MKIFGIGWPKTGTTTLGRCFKIFGYTHKGYSVNLFDNLERTLHVARQFDTFQDLPWYLYYEKMDKYFPGSKFILTTRDSKRWLKSYRNTLAKQDPKKKNALDAIRRKIYGLPFPNVEDTQLVRRYEQHNSEVVRYFRDRPDDLLIVNWEKGDGWKKLCEFLERPIPLRMFPHENKGNYS